MEMKTNVGVEIRESYLAQIREIVDTRQMQSSAQFHEEEL